MKKSLLIALLSWSATAFTQTTPDADLRGWHLSPSQSKLYGIDLDAAYRFLASRNIKSTSVVVAVLDSGIDTLHEDLKPILWMNPGEIPGNGKDDDGNGYIDDIHGWNFLGNPDGQVVDSTSSEQTRTYWRYRDQYEGKKIDAATLSQRERYVYEQWQNARSVVLVALKRENALKGLVNLQRNMLDCDSVLRLHMKKAIYTVEEAIAFIPGSNRQGDAQRFYINAVKKADEKATNKELLEDLAAYIKSERDKVRDAKQAPDDFRMLITGDDEQTPDTRFYGNNNVQTGTPEHGTHVCGIIAAVRNNGLGMDGIADNVRIMLLRTTPKGDEYDKDVAMGIRYAVDNGAKIINMSFGKKTSPNKWMVDDAVRYARSKDVLIVHSAGNSGRNIDGHDSYPCPQFLFTDSLAANWITVGASNNKGEAADFSNYGKNSVDVFAPGVAIYSTVPGGNQYQSIDGTSMAAPMVSGIAAILRSHFPNLSAEAVKDIIEKSVVEPGDFSPLPGGNKTKVPMAQLCKTGGIVNALNAVQLAVSRQQ